MIYAKNCIEIGYYLEELQRNEAGAAHMQQIRSKLKTPLSIYFSRSARNNLIPQPGKSMGDEPLECLYPLNENKPPWEHMWSAVNDSTAL